jgi:hypothetical protein
MNCEVKTFREQHLVLGCIVVSVSIGGTAHQEDAGWHPRELHPEIVREKGADWLNSGRYEASQTVFKLVSIRDVHRLGQRVQEPDQVTPGIALLLKPVGEHQPRAVSSGCSRMA